MNALAKVGLTRESVVAMTRVKSPCARLSGDDVHPAYARRRNKARDIDQLEVLKAIVTHENDAGIATSVVATMLGDLRAAGYVLRRLMARGLICYGKRGRGGHYPRQSLWIATEQGRAACQSGSIQRFQVMARCKDGRRQYPVSPRTNSMRNRVRRLLESGPLTSAEIAAAIGVESVYASAVCNQLLERGEVERVLPPGHRKMKWQIKKVNWRTEHA